MDLGRLCDAFYIGGTKCGCLFGEAIVFPRHDTAPHFFSVIKQRGALLAKGFVAAHQFDALFTDGLYERIGKTAIRSACRIREALTEKGYPLAFDSPTNQVFPILDAGQYARLTRLIEMGFWENLPDGRTIMRLATSWATTDEEVDALIALL
jgi:threonine aldolase